MYSVVYRDSLGTEVAEKSTPTETVHETPLALQYRSFWKTRTVSSDG